jgi:hypothetical protein
MAEKKSNQELAQDLLYAQTSEEVQAEKLINFWRNNKFFLFSLLIAILVATVGVEFYQNWQKNIRLKDSAVYEEASLLASQGENEKAVELFKSLENAKTDYSYLATMRVAGIYFNEGKEEDGIKELDILRTNPKTPEDLKAIVTFSYVGHLLDKEKPEVLQEMLKPYLTTGNIWYGAAAELSALIMIHENKSADAKAFLGIAVKETHLPEAALTRLQILQSVVESK